MQCRSISFALITQQVLTIFDNSNAYRRMVEVNALQEGAEGSISLQIFFLVIYRGGRVETSLFLGETSRLTG